MSSGDATSAVDLDTDTQHLIDQEIAAGHFPDAKALVGAAVRHLLITREDLGYDRHQIDTMIDEAIASLECGEGVDGESFFAELAGEEQARRLR